MDAHRREFALLLLGMMALAGCGSSAGGGSGGALAIRVHGAASFNPSIEHGRIERYRVTVSGEGIEEPIVAAFPGTATEGTIEGIPTGGGRLVAVEAINANDLTIRAGEAPGVDVGGGVSEVEVTLEAVPIFTNIADGNSIDSTRLVFRLFGDPAHPAIVEERTGGAVAPLFDLATQQPEIQLDASTGLGRCAPSLQVPGEHLFAVVDAATGRESHVRVLLLDGTKQRPAPFVTATQAQAGAVACVAPLCSPLP